MGEKVLGIIKEYRKILSQYDRNAEFVKGQLFTLKVIENELKQSKIKAVEKT